MSNKSKKSPYAKSFKTFRENPHFYEEMAILKAQETIAELMKNSGTTRTELAKALSQSKAHVTELLSDGRNLTLRTFARICFHLNKEVDFQTYTIGAVSSVSNFQFSNLTNLKKANQPLDKKPQKNYLFNMYNDSRESYGYKSEVNTHTTNIQDKAA